jgi:hypothetical protein
VIQNRCRVAGTEKTLAVAPKFVSALRAVADLPTFGLPINWLLANQTTEAIKPFEARSTTKGVARMADGRSEPGTATRVTTTVTDLLGDGCGSI